MRMIGVSRSLKSQVKKTNNPPLNSPGHVWYIYTPDREHSWAEHWRDAMDIATDAAREAQIAYLRGEM